MLFELDTWMIREKIAYHVRVGKVVRGEVEDTSWLEGAQHQIHGLWIEKSPLVVARLRPRVRKVDVDCARKVSRQPRRQKEECFTAQQPEVRQPSTLSSSRQQLVVALDDLDTDEAAVRILSSAPQQVAPFAEADLELAGPARLHVVAALELDSEGRWSCSLSAQLGEWSSHALLCSRNRAMRLTMLVAISESLGGLSVRGSGGGDHTRHEASSTGGRELCEEASAWAFSTGCGKRLDGSLDKRLGTVHRQTPGGDADRKRQLELLSFVLEALSADRVL